MIKAVQQLEKKQKKNKKQKSEDNFCNDPRALETKNKNNNNK